MRPISPALAAAQAVRSPRHTVSVTVETRGQGPQDAMVRWDNPVSFGLDAQVERLIAIAGPLANGQVVVFKSTGTGATVHIVTQPDDPTTWPTLLPTTTTVLAGVTIRTMDAAGTGSTVRLFYGNATGLHYIESTDGGLSWAAALAIEAGVALHGDVQATYDETWLVGYSVGFLTTPTARFARWTGVGGSVVTYGAGWRYAGYLAAGWHLFLRQTNTAGDRLVAERWTVAAGWAGSPVRLDAAPGGRFGVRIWWAHTFSACGARMLLLCEGGDHGPDALGMAALWLSGEGDQTVPCMDDPILFPAWRAFDDCRAKLFATATYNHLLSDRQYMVGVPITAPPGSYTPTSYTYDDNELRIEFAAAAAPPGVTPGMLLALTRSAYDGAGQGGSETLRCLVYRTEYGRSAVRFVAYDGLGHLRQARVHRPCLLTPGEGGSFDALAAVRLLAARAGLEVVADYTAVGRAARVTAEAGETLAGVVGRLARVTLVLIPHTDASFSLMLIPTGLDPAINAGWASRSGHHPFAVAEGTHLLHERADGSADPAAACRAWDLIQVNDARRYALATVVALATGDLEEGGVVVSRDGPRVDGLRPVVVYQVNRLLDLEGAIEVAEAEARRQILLQVDLLAEVNAHLGAELCDNVTVTDELQNITAAQYRIVALREVWDRGRLTQRWSLASREWWNLL